MRIWYALSFLAGFSGLMWMDLTVHVPLIASVMTGIGLGACGAGAWFGAKR